MSVKITKEVVGNIAFLSRIKLSDEEMDDFTVQLNKILEYMDKLNCLDTNGTEPTSHVTPVANLMRRDEPRDSLPLEESLQNAPDRHSNYFKVPRILADNHEK